MTSHHAKTTFSPESRAHRRGDSPLSFSAYSSSSNIQHIRHLDYVVQRQSLLKSLRGSGLLTAADASSTAPWMTFDYINRVFALPPQYLQTTLSITDSRYPRLTIEEYAEDAKVSQLSVLTAVQNAIHGYTKADQ